jgi:hypothetical protein
MFPSVTAVLGFDPRPWVSRATFHQMVSVRGKVLEGGNALKVLAHGHYWPWKWEAAFLVSRLVITNHVCAGTNRAGMGSEVGFLGGFTICDLRLTIAETRADCAARIT